MKLKDDKLFGLSSQYNIEVIDFKKDKTLVICLNFIILVEYFKSTSRMFY
jgi:hypothetical protein